MTTTPVALTFEVPVPLMPVHRPRKRGGVPYHTPAPLGPPLSANWRLHWRETARRVQETREAVTTAAAARRIPPGSHLAVQLHYRPADNRSTTDSDNLAPTLKACCDALARGRAGVGLALVPDDKPEHMTKPGPVIHPPGKPARMWLVVEVTP